MRLRESKYCAMLAANSSNRGEQPKLTGYEMIAKYPKPEILCLFFGWSLLPHQRSTESAISCVLQQECSKYEMQWESGAVPKRLRINGYTKTSRFVLANQHYRDRSDSGYRIRSCGCSKMFD